MRRVGMLLTALAVCGLATTVMGGQYPVPRTTWTGSSPYYRAPQYRVVGQTVYASPQDSSTQDPGYSGQVYATGYANSAYVGSSCGGCGSCGSGAAGPCAMTYAVPKEPGCCDYSPSCCDHIWDGYCQEKQQRIEHWRSFYSGLKSALRQPCLGGCGGYGCGRCCGRAVRCQPACGCEVSAGTVSESSMTPAEAAEPATEPQPEPKSPPPAPEPKPLKLTPDPAEAPAESAEEPALPLPPAPTE